MLMHIFAPHYLKEMLVKKLDLLAQPNRGSRRTAIPGRHYTSALARESVPVENSRKAVTGRNARPPGASFVVQT